MTKIKDLEVKAKQGDVEAQFNLAEAYYRGKGISKNVKKAVELWTRAAEQGHAGSQRSLGGVQYFAWSKQNGEKYTGKDSSELGFIKLFRKAAKKKDRVAQYNLGALYFNGEGVPKDYKKAVEWWELAAKQGYTPAQTVLREKAAYWRKHDKN